MVVSLVVLADLLLSSPPPKDPPLEPPLDTLTRCADTSGDEMSLPLLKPLFLLLSSLSRRVAVVGGVKIRAPGEEEEAVDIGRGGK